MASREDFLIDCVTTVVSDDYESFEIVWNQVRRLGALKRMDFTQSEVAEAIEKSIRLGRVEAYLLSSREPFSTKVACSREQLHSLWFYVTPEGKKVVRGIPELLGDEPEDT